MQVIHCKNQQELIIQLLVWDMFQPAEEKYLYLPNFGVYDLAWG